ncbi:MAG: PLP-dependent cysteine synthase family protein [bacterium]|jgi:cysteine synthase A
MKDLQANILQLIGETPLVRLQKVTPGQDYLVLAKLEMLNVGGSAKTRPALAMVEAAEKEGILKPGSIIAEATSGNTGIGLAVIGAVKGYRVIIVMPDNASIERQQLIRAYGGEVILTPQAGGMTGAIEKLKEIQATSRDVFIPGQYQNEANPGSHYRTTGKEILRQYPGRIDAWVAGVGTGGTLIGVARALQEAHPALQVIAAMPAVTDSKIAGIRRIEPGGFVPSVLDRAMVDSFVAVPDDAAIAMARELARREGILGGISGGAAVWAAVETAKKLGPGKTVVTLLPDTGERYFSTDLFPKE